MENYVLRLVLGFDGAPSAGDKFNVFEDEKEARAIATKRHAPSAIRASLE